MNSKRLDPVGWWSEHPWVDYLVAAIPLSIHLLFVVRTGRADVLNWIDISQRQSLYSAGAGVVAVIGGLAAIALALYQSLSGDRSRAIRELYGDSVRRNWRSLLIITGLSAGLCLVALATDRAGDPLYSRFVFEVALAVWAVRFVRLLWLFNAFLKANDRESSDHPRPDAPPVSERWMGLRVASGE